MRKFVRYMLPLAIIILSILVVVVMGIVAKSKRPERKADGPRATLVETIEVTAGSLNFKVNSQGSVAPRTETILIAEVAGRVVSVSPNFVAGGFFRSGETLLQIDPSDYETALKRAEAALASRRAALADAEARADQARKDWQALGRAGEPPDLVARKPQLDDARANVLAAEADLEKAQRDLQRTRISLPYDGLLREKRVDIGQYVNPGAQLGVSFAVDSAEVRLPLSAADLEFLELPAATGRKGNMGPADFPTVLLISEEGGNRHEWQARIIRTEGVLDAQSRVLYAVAQVVDPYGLLGQSSQAELRMGTFVRAEIEGRRVEGVVTLPRHALRGDHSVLVANADLMLEIREVSVARADPREVYITQGLVEGERVVITTLEAPIPGMQLALAGAEPTVPETEGTEPAGNMVQ